jgi:hypothetical protein
MTEKQYRKIVEIAKEIYDTILDSTDPCHFQQKELKGNHLSAVTNRWLTFKNIRDSALKQNFSLITIGYNRNDAILAAKAENDPARQAFVEWAVDFIQTKTTRRKITKQALFDAWGEHGGQTCARSYFTATQGTPLNMEKLRKQAFPDGQGRPAPAASGSEDDYAPGGGGGDSDLESDGREWLRGDESLVGAAASTSSASSDAAIEQNQRNAAAMKAIEIYFAEGAKQEKEKAEAQAQQAEAQALQEAEKKETAEAKEKAAAAAACNGLDVEARGGAAAADFGAMDLNAMNSMI